MLIVNIKMCYQVKLVIFMICKPELIMLSFLNKKNKKVQFHNFLTSFNTLR